MGTTRPLARALHHSRPAAPLIPRVQRLVFSPRNKSGETYVFIFAVIVARDELGKFFGGPLTYPREYIAA